MFPCKSLRLTLWATYLCQKKKDDHSLPPSIWFFYLIIYKQKSKITNRYTLTKSKLFYYFQVQAFALWFGEDFLSFALLILASSLHVTIVLSGTHICKLSMHQYWKSLHPFLLLAANLPSFQCSLLAPVSCFDHHLVRYVTYRERWNIIHPPLLDPC